MTSGIWRGLINSRLAYVKELRKTNKVQEVTAATPTQFSHNLANDVVKRNNKDGKAIIKSLTSKYVRVFCKDCGGLKFLFATDAEATDFIDRYKADMLKVNGYAPKRSYWCDACQGYHVTSQSVRAYRPNGCGDAVKVNIGVSRQSLKSVHRVLNRIDQLICRAFHALSEHRLSDTRKLCSQVVGLFDSLSGLPGAALRRDALMGKLNECVSGWAAENAKLQAALVRVTYKPNNLFTKQWYMIESVA